MRRGYGMRQGRQTPYRRRKGRGLLIVLLFLLCLCVVAYFFISENIVFTADGMRLQWFESKTPPKVEPPIDPPPVVIEPPTPDSPIPSPPVTPVTPDKSAVMLNALWVDTAKMADRGYLDSLLAAGETQLIFTAKDDEGLVHLPVSGTYQNPVTPQSTAIADNLAYLQEQGVYVIANLSVLRDGVMARQFRQEAVMTPQKQTWLDWDSVTWFQPDSVTAGAYTLAVIEALKAVGVDEVLLSNLSYPINGKTNLIGSHTTAEPQKITDLLTKIKAGGLPVGVMADPEKAQTMGHNLPDLAAVADRVATNRQVDLSAQLGENGRKATQIAKDPQSGQNRIKTIE